MTDERTKKVVSGKAQPEDVSLADAIRTGEYTVLQEDDGYPD